MRCLPSLVDAAVEGPPRPPALIKIGFGPRRMGRPIIISASASSAGSFPRPLEVPPPTRARRIRPARPSRHDLAPRVAGPRPAVLHLPRFLLRAAHTQVRPLLLPRLLAAVDQAGAGWPLLPSVPRADRHRGPVDSPRRRGHYRYCGQGGARSHDRAAVAPGDESLGGAGQERC